MAVPSLRVRAANAAPVRRDREYVLYWMVAARRTRFHFGLERAVELAADLGRPLVVLEALRCDYRWASDRLHRFVFEGMADNAARFDAARVAYHPYVEPSPGAGRGLLEALAARAAAVVTDEFPCFFLPRMVASAGARLDVRLEAVDANGLLPVADADRAYPTAYAFRRHLQKRLPAHLASFPEPDPLAEPGLFRGNTVPHDVAARWPGAPRAALADPEALVRRLPIDHGVGGVAATRGGERAAREALARFVDGKLDGYAESRNEPEREAASGLSPYLHFGHLSIHEILAAIAAREGWTATSLGTTASGKREGFWGLSPGAEAFLDEAVTWRELGHNFCARRPDYDRFESLPDWARRTLAEHAADPRPWRYDLAAFEQARTHDPLWNAAQRQLVAEGRIHNYLRMLWGKKILEWSADPEAALSVMIELNNKYALDGRDPNSYTGIFWVLGRFDRPWAPVRPVFGSIRYMSSENTARKLAVRGYVRRYGEGGALFVPQ